ncbi:hypothetical protein NSS79_28250 [Paenibacillus sp. FSL L8-0436]|uniref:hypothetical protein n=1 Tax=Paenibacillus sp. FSL L8-0436 TaxID=2954686 RepID=UPI00315807E8
MQAGKHGHQTGADACARIAARAEGSRSVRLPLRAAALQASSCHGGGRRPA